MYAIITNTTSVILYTNTIPKTFNSQTENKQQKETAQVMG